MPKVKVTSEFKVEIPEDVRDRINVNPGREYKVHLHGDHIILTPVREKDESRPYPTVRPRQWSQTAEC
jgi:AbrB family looped-hinge helix DNA binding protein